MGTDAIGQYDGKNSIVFMPAESELLQEEYKKNQLVKCKTTKQSEAVGKIVEQSNLLHACFKLLMDNSDDPNHGTMAGVKLSCKIGIDFRDPRYCFVRPDGGVQLTYRSFSIYGPNKLGGPKKLEGEEREKVVQQAFQWTADQLGVEVDEMVEVAQEMMVRRK